MLYICNTQHFFTELYVGTHSVMSFWHRHAFNGSHMKALSTLTQNLHMSIHLWVQSIAFFANIFEAHFFSSHIYWLWRLLARSGEYPSICHQLLEWKPKAIDLHLLYQQVTGTNSFRIGDCAGHFKLNCHQSRWCDASSSKQCSTIIKDNTHGVVINRS